MYCLSKFSSGCHPLTQGMPRVRSSLHTTVQSSTHSLLLQIQWYFVMWNEKDQSLCSACVYAKEVMGNPVATRASLSSPCLRGKLAWVLLTAVVQASHSYPVTPAVLQPAKMACLLCIETQDRGAQSVVLIAYFTGVSICVIFLVLWGLLPGAHDLPWLPFFPLPTQLCVYLNSLGVFLPVSSENCPTCTYILMCLLR